MLIQRIFSSIILISLATIAVFNVWVFRLMIMAVTVLGLYEFFTMLERKGISIYKYVGIGLGSFIPLSIMFQFELTRKWELFFIVLAFLLLTMMQFKRRQSQGAIVGISTTLFGILYVSWFFSFIIKIRLLDNGVGFLAVLLISTKLGDIGAYLIGMSFGRTPLLPRISPKKSVEGAIGGLFFSVLGAVLCKPMLPFSYGHLVLIGIGLGVLAQLGDLSESLMKRDCQIKDSSAILPGMGGVLDVVDSILFTAPVFYFYINIILNYRIY
ncbi:MAG: phosphatidate cytidylyltransferase [Candidatus Omnitrophica bacterium]|nr:phosphatidate cytidylyltransferase [Candidatus Omnitrophota bacterium]